MVEKKIGDKTVRLIVGDITDTQVDAFVYDIEEDAKLGSGYGGAIAVRGGQGIQKELNEIGRCPKGEAIATSAGSLKAEHIIYVNGPKFHEPGTEKILRKATLAALKLADEKGVKTLALPPVGTGLYQVPLDLCADVMVDAVEEYLKGDTNLDEVVFVALDTREYQPLQSKIGGGA